MPTPPLIATYITLYVLVAAGHGGRGGGGGGLRRQIQAPASAAALRRSAAGSRIQRPPLLGVEEAPPAVDPAHRLQQ